MIAPETFQFIVPSTPDVTERFYFKVMIPAFAMPSSILLHALSLRQLRALSGWKHAAGLSVMARLAV
jgi:hypothetical protein